jgi:hypothetical protein
MDIDPTRLQEAALNTEVLRHPRQQLDTFGSTTIHYYLLTEPSYKEISGDTSETVIREGQVIAERPKIVTPYYLSHLEGFSGDARKYFDMLMSRHGPNMPGLFYTYKNQPGNLNIVSDSWQAVVDRLSNEIDSKSEPLSSIIRGQDDLWDVSLLKFIYETTARSIPGNLAELKAHGMLGMVPGGIPAGVGKTIDEMFRQVADGNVPLWELERELNRWGVFEEYQDRFFSFVKNMKKK